jgi:Fe-Mn family superoxide dismutase
MENINRRKFVATTLKAGAITVAMPLVASAENMFKPNAPALTFSQVKLPYAYNALEPHIDAMTMEIHYTKHHTAYIKNVNDAIAAENISAATE